MQLSRSILAFFFLFVYSLGFGQCNSPLCQNEDFETETSGKVHNHEHHEHSSDENSNDHEDIEHNGHLDEGILDLFACVFSDITFVDVDCELYINTNLSDDLKADSKIKLAAVLIVVCSDLNLVNAACSVLSNEQTLFFDIPIVRSNSLRGPPVISC